jgi:hypothetical protein
MRWAARFVMVSEASKAVTSYPLLRKARASRASEDLRIRVGPLLRERLEGLPLALARRSESFAGSWGGCAAPVRDLDY